MPSRKGHRLGPGRTERRGPRSRGWDVSCKHSHCGIRKISNRASRGPWSVVRGPWSAPCFWAQVPREGNPRQRDSLTPCMCAAWVTRSPRCGQRRAWAARSGSGKWGLLTSGQYGTPPPGSSLLSQALRPSCPLSNDGFSVQMGIQRAHFLLTLLAAGPCGEAAGVGGQALPLGLLPASSSLCSCGCPAQGRVL